MSVALKLIDFFQPRFTIRSGGHSPNPGWSSTGQPGLLIDMAGLNEIVVSSDKQTVSLGPGNRWGNVIEEVDTYGISVVGGRIPSVGVGGLMIGGKDGGLSSSTRV